MSDGETKVGTTDLLASRRAFEEQWEKENGPWPHRDDVAELDWISTRNEAAKWWIRGFKEANTCIPEHESRNDNKEETR